MCYNNRPSVSINFFQNITGSSVVDCISDENEIYFIVAKGHYGLTVGKGGSKIRNAEKLFKKNIRIFEYSDNLEEFIRNIIPETQEIIIEAEGIEVHVKNSDKPRVIGKSGKNINEMTEAVKQRFGLDNPQLDVKLIRNPNLDPRIVAKQIASALEKGYNYKKIGNLTMKRVMDSGAIGAQIIISGKLGGGKGITGKFQEGYLKHCGEPARTLVDYGFEEAQTRPGKIGIKVKIMREFQDITGKVRDKVEHKVDISEAPEEEAKEEKPSPVHRRSSNCCAQAEREHET